MHKNKFKIIVPSYNNEQWVETNIESILEQTYDNYDVLYIDDASSDNTWNLVNALVRNNPKFTLIRNEKNMGSTYNSMKYVPEFLTADEEILVHIDGDDWLAIPNVLEKLNDFYNKNGCWMTYGGYIDWRDGDKLTKPYPQNTKYDDFVHKHSIYKQDLWRASHLHTYKWFLYKGFDYENDMKSKIDNKYFWHAADLQVNFSLLEMCPIDKIGVLDFVAYVYNASEKNQIRTRERELNENKKFEREIRNKKKFKRVTSKEDLRGEKLPQINVFGDNCERHTIPTKFSFVYNRTFGDFDIIVLQDDYILKYLNGDLKIERKCPIVANVCEPPHLFNQQSVYRAVKENYTEFDRILAWHPDFQNLTNCVFKPVTEISQWNLLPDTELDTSLFKIYPKNKKVSFITSNKTFSDGHKFRIRCLDMIKDEVDAYGRGINEIKCKLDGLKDYQFSVTIENGKFDNWFTEKIIDCFLSGTIPIYHGCNNISDYFNTDGIISFNTIEELVDIISNLKDEDYNKRLEAVNDNFNKALEWWEDNDRFFNKYLKDLIGE